LPARHNQQMPASTAEPRDALRTLVAAITPTDVVEAEHREHVLAWIGSEAPLYRVRRPDVPPMHLVSYFVPVDPDSGEVLLVEHRNAGLLLPPGGHCEQGELPWDTVVREFAEELHAPAFPHSTFGTAPAMVTVTRTRDRHGRGDQHVDVSLWHVLHVDRGQVTNFDAEEFTGIGWYAPAAVLRMPQADLDPHMHRFVTKFLARVQLPDL